jgi:hypothetical protein
MFTDIVQKDMYHVLMEEKESFTDKDTKEQNIRAKEECIHKERNENENSIVSAAQQNIFLQSI